MIVLKSTHDAKVAELNHTIAILQESNRAKDAIIRQRGEEQDTLTKFACSCLSLLHEIDISTRKPGGKEQQARRIALFEEAQGIGLWPVEEVQSVTE